MAPENTIQTLHPDRGKSGPRISRTRYDAFRDAILRVLPARGPGVLFKELPDKVRALLPAEVLDELGSVSWYTTVVKLDLEARGEIERVSGAKPQRLRLVED